MANGLDEKRALEHMERIRAVDRAMEGRIRIFTGIEVDILADGALDLDDEVLAQMDVVIASVHSRFDQSREEMTARVLRAIENPYVRILGHPTGGRFCAASHSSIDLAAIFKRAAELGVAMEHNAAPGAARPVRPRPAPGQGTGLQDRRSIRTAHDTRELGFMTYGVRQLRRAWLTADDVLNTRGPEEFLAALRPRSAPAATQNSRK